MNALCMICSLRTMFLFKTVRFFFVVSPLNSNLRPVSPDRKKGQDSSVAIQWFLNWITNSFADVQQNPATELLHTAHM